MRICLVIVQILFQFSSVLSTKDYYELLGITRSADNKEIRRAFKQLALKLHPDKNDAPDAHEKFLELNKAYDVLKDEDKRKKYDLFGEDGLDESSGKSRYQSWTYYRDDFGIYDDDPEVVTLDSADFQRSVLESHDLWFINFYSPRCGHCHTLAPTWRKLARALKGVMRVGAVNCAEENWLCQRQGIQGYPSLKLLTLDGTSKYSGPREEDDIMRFLLRHLEDPVIDIWEGNFKQWTRSEANSHKPWLFLFCSQQDECPDGETRKLVGASLQGLVNIGLVDCKQDEDVCTQLRGKRDSKILYFKDKLESNLGIELSADVHDHLEISRSVLSLLPGPTELDAEAFRELESRLEQGLSPGWLILFTNKKDGDSLEYAKLSYLVPRLRFGKVDCSVTPQVCNSYSVHKYPSFMVMKVGGHHELNYGRTDVQDIATFARISAQARTMRTLKATDFPALLTENSHVIVDFFAPWCPPCMQLLPEFRKASNQIGGSIIFGTVDCTVHRRLCNEHKITGYPTTIFFNNTKPHRYTGGHNADSMSEFVQDVLRPSVVDLDQASFKRLVESKSEDEMWLVDFFAPWCGPCRQLEPTWSALGRKLERNKNIKIGKVDCEKEQRLCASQAVNSYPTIRMYPLNSYGIRKFTKYTGYHRDLSSLYQWIQSSLPSDVISLTPHTFQHQVLSTSSPWLVQFSAPWCGHCVRFAPDYEQIATTLKNKIKVAKVNCDRYKQLCQQAGITGYPTIRFYRGSEKLYTEEYYSEDIKTRDPDKIILVVEEKLKSSKISDNEKSESTDKSSNHHDEL